MLAVKSFMPKAFVVVNKMCKKFGDEQGRYVYTTPKSYLEMLATFQQMLHNKRAETDKKIFRLESGVEQLEKGTHPHTLTICFGVAHWTRLFFLDRSNIRPHTHFSR